MQPAGWTALNCRPMILEVGLGRPTSKIIVVGLCMLARDLTKDFRVHGRPQAGARRCNCTPWILVSKIFLPCSFQERIVILAIIRGYKQETPYKSHQRPQHPR